MHLLHEPLPAVVIWVFTKYTPLELLESQFTSKKRKPERYFLFKDLHIQNKTIIGRKKETSEVPPKTSHHSHSTILVQKTSLLVFIKPPQ